jgi:hypothetical protein
VTDTFLVFDGQWFHAVVEHKITVTGFCTAEFQVAVTETRQTWSVSDLTHTPAVDSPKIRCVPRKTVVMVVNGSGVWTRTKMKKRYFPPMKIPHKHAHKLVETFGILDMRFSPHLWACSQTAWIISMRGAVSSDHRTVDKARQHTALPIRKYILQHRWSRPEISSRPGESAIW